MDHGPTVDRSQTTITEYWRAKGFEFVDHPQKADVIIRKAELSTATLDLFRNDEPLERKFLEAPSVLFIGEPRELAWNAYRFADKLRTLAVAPGNEFQKMYFGRPWSDPQIEDWNKRLDRFVWIGRPIGHRLKIAQKLVEQGLPLDIYSREPWPLDCWKGPAKDDVETARAYKFRIACENSNAHLYHSEKLFTSIKSGCVSFYWGDPKLDLSFAKGAFLSLTPDNVARRNELAPKLLEGMNQFMFSKDWEIYSIRAFIDRSATLIQSCLENSWWNFELQQPLKEQLPF